MTNRRQFIQNGLALSAESLAVPGGLRAEAAAVRLADHVAELFIFDGRIAGLEESSKQANR